MHLIEVRQTLHDTTAVSDIYHISKIVKEIQKYVDKTEEISYTDFAYITAILDKSKTLLYKAYTIFQLNGGELDVETK